MIAMSGEAREQAGEEFPISDEEIKAGYRRYEHRLTTEPLAVGVKYRRTNDLVVITMNNGAELRIPRKLLQGLSDATAHQLAHVVIEGDGLELSWPDLDADFTMMGLLRGIYGGRRWMAELARYAGSTTSPAKAAAARANGKKGGRPRIAAASSPSPRKSKGAKRIKS